MQYDEKRCIETLEKVGAMVNELEMLLEGAKVNQKVRYIIGVIQFDIWDALKCEECDHNPCECERCCFDPDHTCVGCGRCK